MGLTSPKVAARLFVAMTMEAALIELEADGRVPGARKTIRTLVKASPRRCDGWACCA